MLLRRSLGKAEAWAGDMVMLMVGCVIRLSCTSCSYGLAAVLVLHYCAVIACGGLQ